MSCGGSISLPNLAVRGSRGFCLQKPQDYAINPGFSPDESKEIKVFSFSHDGSRLAWSNKSTVQVATNKDDVWTVSTIIEQPKVSVLQWSPQSTLLATWEVYSTTAGQEAKPNMHLWNPKTGEKVKSFFQKKFASWCPIWTMDEAICARMVNNEVHFYAANNFSEIAHKILLQKVSEFSLSPNVGTSHVVTYVPGQKGGPSICKLWQFPNFGENQVLANKSFFQADSVDIYWNRTGSAVLLLVQAEVDKTGASYYGKQQLHFITTKGDTAMIQLPKNGPIYSVTWSPKGTMFSVVHGFMPAKTALYNNKGEQIFDFGTGPKNMSMFNPQSSILMIGGFGNLRGKIDMWNVTSAKPELISSFDAPDTTDVKWNPDGQHLLTTTCAPRLRIGNGYKIWHYSGSLIHEKPFASADQLWEADWQSAPPGAFPPFPISRQAVQGIQSSQVKESKQVYRPPGARGTPSSFKLHDDEDEDCNNKPSGPAGQQGNNKDKEDNLSKSALKNKKRREAAKKKREEEEAATAMGQQFDTNNHNQQNSSNNEYRGAAGLLFDPELEKKKKKINDKLMSINKLKDLQAEGKTLEKNQLEKLSREKELLEELKTLSVRA